MLFVTLDPPTVRHTAASIEGAYAAAAALELDFVWPPVGQLQGPFTLPFDERTVSVTRWLDGERPRCSTSDLPDWLGALHRAPIPAAAPVWTTEVDPRVADRCRDLVLAPWDGPLGLAARLVLLEHLSQVVGWVKEHTFLAQRADPSTYVVTHGEPGVHNQWRARGRTSLIDWESLRLAPRERDLATLVHAGVATDGDPGMIRLFDLEWRLSEIWSFARWLQGAHEGDADDRSARGRDRGTNPLALRRRVIRTDRPSATATPRDHLPSDADRGTRLSSPEAALPPRAVPSRALPAS